MDKKERHWLTDLFWAGIYCVYLYALLVALSEYAAV